MEVLNKKQTGMRDIRGAQRWRCLDLRTKFGIASEIGSYYHLQPGIFGLLEAPAAVWINGSI
jgi:hypothetical protein